MPRIKPPRSQNTAPLAEPQDLAPLTEEVEIDLAEEPGGPSEVDLSAQPPTEPEPQAEPAPRAAPAPEPAEPLQQRLAESERADQLARENARIAQERDAALRRAAQIEREREQEAIEREDDSYARLMSDISAHQALLESARRDIRTAKAAGDTDAEIDAVERMTDAKSLLSQLEINKRTFESRRESRTTQPQSERQPAPAAPQDFESRLSSIAGLPDNAKDWLRKHPEFVNDTTMNNKIGATHNYLTQIKNVPAFSQAYFDALDQEFGFKAAAPAPEPDPQPQPAPQQRTMPMRAPVSRDVPTASGQRAPSNRITLTPEERQIARTSFTAPDMTDAQKEYAYAQNKARLQKMRANGSYPQPERN